MRFPTVADALTWWTGAGTGLPPDGFRCWIGDTECRWMDGTSFFGGAGNIGDGIFVPEPYYDGTVEHSMRGGVAWNAGVNAAQGWTETTGGGGSVTLATDETTFATALMAQTAYWRNTLNGADRTIMYVRAASTAASTVMCAFCINNGQDQIQMSFDADNTGTPPPVGGQTGLTDFAGWLRISYSSIAINDADFHEYLIEINKTQLQQRLWDYQTMSVLTATALSTLFVSATVWEYIGNFTGLAPETFVVKGDLAETLIEYP